MSENIIEVKSFDFAVDIVNLCKELIGRKVEFALVKQLIRSGTSIGANVKEALRGQSRPDFVSKMNIALKEANEAEYWIRLLIKTNYLGDDEGKNILNKCRELCKILTSIVKTARNNSEVGISN